MNLISFCVGTIKYSFYALFLFVPFIFAGNTSELFELNKMWFTWAVSILILFAWATKMIVERRFFIKRTPLDIPLLLFLLSQIISTIFSLDQHVSWWGYYSRFNGGLLSTIAYVFLYFAFVTHVDKKQIITFLKIILIGGVFTAVWGFPSHFGYDPTCLVFRGSFDTTCWTDAFKPTIRVFSTLGQPAWFAAYLATLIPLALAFALLKIQQNKFLAGWYLTIALLFYANLIFTNTRAGFIAFVISIVLFWVLIFIKKLFATKLFLRYFVIVNLLFLLCTFLFGIPFEGLRKFTLVGIQTSQTQQNATPEASPSANPAPEAPPVTQTAITDSGTIRQYVWQGAIDAWRSHALFGTGVETFAFAYYKFRPEGHNLTSEWDYLYNKAHNEYLNYLTTTGLFGLLTYLSFIGFFAFLTLKPVCKSLLRQPLTSFFHYAESTKPDHLRRTEIFVVALFSGWVSILITNFFGFSVVIMNLFLFLLPLFVLILTDQLSEKSVSLGSETTDTPTINPYQWTAIVLLVILCLWMFWGLLRYWNADTKYALGSNLDRAEAYQTASPLLIEAVQIKPNEPVYKDELAINFAVMAVVLAQNNDKETAVQLASNAITLNDQVITKHPNNVVYWKNRVRLFYTLARAVSPEQQLVYYQEALKAIQKAAELAPTDAKIAYNLGALYGQTGDFQKGIEVLSNAIKMKPDYRDAYYALGLLYRQAALNENGQVVNQALNQKAIETYQEILKRFDPNDTVVLTSLDEWDAGGPGRTN